jgi:hypothetical protein
LASFPEIVKIREDMRKVLSWDIIRLRRTPKN